MPAKHSRHIALTGSLVEWAEHQVARGEYTSVSDLIRTAVRFLKAHEEGRREALSLTHEPETVADESCRLR
ncbi:type II toxin-antitoxin system ParD family antitoxin [Methylobacterium sp. J-090]|uniref:ribbon-helix-helix domain-containing protein n=1 Tax=Methylobacterium sp. J-090 TaxID=2836666 RepID=UPI001FBAD117|nr:type II toxin-antitoxin system ParD family antitoxin [Methylobacterium sp. J-090]MCJ2080174.1 type II toxin-antitoxin system ParD family antitoxin [Methylobacterium sp. J-090]